MRRPWYLAALLGMAACDAEPARNPSAADPLVRSRYAASTVIASVTGQAEQVRYGGELLRGLVIDASVLPDGLPSGTIQVLFDAPSRFLATPDSEPPAISFEVTCLSVDGNRAWIGGRITAPTTAPWVGSEDVWYVEDGGGERADRLGAWIGRPAHTCHERGEMPWAEEREKGEMAVR